MRRTNLVPLTFAFLLACAGILRAQEPALKDTFQQAKAAWATQGDREGATAKFNTVLAALEPKAVDLAPEARQMLCETYNWMAVLEDRVPARRDKAPRFLESALALDPDFEIDRNITNARLQGAFDALRAARFGRVRLDLDPEGGVLTLDGKPMPAASAAHYLPAGAHVFSYARPGYAPRQLPFDLALKETKALSLKLEWTSSVLTVYCAPAGAEVLLDDKVLGTTSGRAPDRLAPAAQQLGLAVDQFSSGFQLAALEPGKHLLELRAPCHQSRRLEIGEALTTPFADHELEPIVLPASRATLSVRSAAPGGELFLDQQSYGQVPIQDLPVCAQRYELQVHYPAGLFTQSVDLAEGQSLTVVARPKPRLTFAGLEGAEDFPGRERLAGQLAGLGSRLSRVAFATAAPGESAEACAARLQASRETELLLRARPVGHPVRSVELDLATLSGEEEQFTVMPLEQDPLAPFVARLEAPLVLSEPWAGLTLVDLNGPWVLQADAAATRAGVKVGLPILQANGKPVASVADFRKLLRALPAPPGSDPARITVSQGGAPVTLPVQAQPLEIPVNAPQLCYPLALAELHLAALGAAGDQGGVLRLEQALALIHFREYDRALELLREVRVTSTQGVCQGTLDYYTGLCLQHMGSAYQGEAIQAFNQALKYPQATLFGPDGPQLAPLAQQALDDLKP